MRRHHKLIFYATWLLLGLMQSGLTELQDDEAYYWVYSQYPDLGYFDHPPMIAFLIKAGYSVFHNELGVRLLCLLLNIFTLVIIERLLVKKNDRLFYAIALSLAVLQLAGFLAVPDTPLLFFTALFFLCYKKFLEKADKKSILFLGIVMALLMYSKYQGILIILFTLLSNISLFRRFPIYNAGLIALICYIPHLLWQMEFNWVSVRYHLFESNVNDYKISHTLSYIGGQLLLPGPIAGFILLPAAFYYKSPDKLIHALRFTLFGIYIFFLISSFRGKVEVNWTLPVLIPIFILSHAWMNENQKWQRSLFRLLPISLILVLVARIVMIENILPIKAIETRYHAWKKWPEELKKKTNGLPAVFSNSYQRASKYWFYTGQMSYSQNLYTEHRNSYNIWPIEDYLLGHPVCYMDIYELDRFTDSIKTPIGTIGYRIDSVFHSFAKIEIKPSDKNVNAREGETIGINGEVKMPRNYWVYIFDHHEIKAEVLVAVFNKKGWIKDIKTDLTLQQLKRDSLDLRFNPELSKGKYKLMFAIRSNDYYPTHNSEKFSLTVH